MFLDVLFPLHVKKIIFVDADLVRISLSKFSFVPNCMEYYNLYMRSGVTFSPFSLPSVDCRAPLKEKQKQKESLSQVRSIAPVSLACVRSEAHDLQLTRFSSYLGHKRGSLCQAFLVETVEIGTA